MPTLAGYSHLSLSVTDLDKSTEWYRALLGFTLDSEVKGDGFRRNRLRHPDAGITLEIGGDKLTLDKASPADRQRLVEAFLARHGGG
jgi:catechol 2,3-dioxygenase-like lactoylglutathione lyase family enzyme